MMMMIMMTLSSSLDDDDDDYDNVLSDWIETIAFRYLINKLARLIFNVYVVYYRCWFSLPLNLAVVFV